VTVPFCAEESTSEFGKLMDVIEEERDRMVMIAVAFNFEVNFSYVTKLTLTRDRLI
jgi:hypothetical protein